VRTYGPSPQISGGSTGQFRRTPGKTVRPDDRIASDALTGAGGKPAPWTWDFETDGALALDQSRKALQGEASFVTVLRMPPTSGHALAVRRRRAEVAAARRKRRLVGLLLLAAVALITLLLTAFGSKNETAPVRTTAPAPSTRLLPSGPPQPQVVAMWESMRLELPIAQPRVTAIGYHASGDGALALDPVGHQVNQGLVSRLARHLFGGGGTGLRYYVLDGGTGATTATLDIGAAPGTDVYSPVDGTIVGITPYVLDGKRYGARIDIQPTGNPSIVVSLTHLTPDPSLTVGSTVGSTTSKVGTVVNLAGIEHQALSRYTPDAGNHVSLSVHPAAALSFP
jgi:hypothetical protein